jgi:hypothetical protein
LSATDQGSRFVDGTAIINQQWACYGLATIFAFYNFTSLFFHASADWRWQSFDRRSRFFGLDGEHGKVVMATPAASSAANQMLRVTRLKLRGKPVHLFHEFLVWRHDEILHQNRFDALLDRDYPRQYHSPSRFDAPVRYRER